jgi:hypothetical protein
MTKACAAFCVILAVAVTSAAAAAAAMLYANGQLSIGGALQFLPLVRNGMGSADGAGLSPELMNLKQELLTMRRKIQEEDVASALIAGKPSLFFRSLWRSPPCVVQA